MFDVRGSKLYWDKAISGTAGPAIRLSIKRLIQTGRQVEERLAAAAILAMAVIPVVELILRTLFHAGIPGAYLYVQNLTLWVGFLGAMVASREQRHLSLNTTSFVFSPQLRRLAVILGAMTSAAVAAGLFWASLQFVAAEMNSPARLGGWLPLWVSEAILPVAFFVIAVRFVVQAGAWRARFYVFSAVSIAGAIVFLLPSLAPSLLWPGIGGLLVAAISGAPIFIVLGGAGLLLFFAEGTPIASVTVETYKIIASPQIPAIPLFTLTGFLLAEGGASRRLVRLFQAFFGWIPGGLAIAVTLVCAFFTTFTGASGITILALGGLLLPALLENRHKEKFSLGLLTSTGSIGLLFPPSLPLILYGVFAHVPITDLFKAGIVPGTLMVGAVSLYSVWRGGRSDVTRAKFDIKQALSALWAAKWEAFLPVLALAAIFSGFCTLIESAAITVVYALVIEAFIHRDLNLAGDAPRVLARCVVLLGGVFIILGVAMGLTNYLVDAEIPAKATAWVQGIIQSKLVFLLVLNLFLIAVGCLMDIYAAIVVVVPLIVPIARSFEVDPLHLGMIFLANLELGYLTPPVGMNLFLASYRFDKPLIEVYRSTIPFFLLLLMVVLVITYVPALTLTIPRLAGG